MSTTSTLAVWRVQPTRPPAVLRRCPRCDTVRPFASSDRFRVNANGRRLDVWLIYRCVHCDATWNREIHARVAPEALAPDRYAAYLSNDAELAMHIACKPCGLPTDKTTAFVIDRPLRAPAIRLAVPYPLAVRLDRVLAKGLGWSRSQVRAAVRSNLLDLPGGEATLRRPVQDEFCFRLNESP